MKNGGETQTGKTLLESISDKEHDLKESSILTGIRAKEIISNAKTQANIILDNAEKEGREEAESLYQKEMSLLDEEKVRIQQEGMQIVEEIRESGKARLPEVVASVVRFVTK